MIKLYKSIDETLNYWETWNVSDAAAVVHWGVVGERGRSHQIDGEGYSTLSDEVRKLVEQKLAEGYSEIDDENRYTLLIEYEIDGMGTSDDVDKRHRLEDRMNDTLGWTGLGHCDGGSIGSGTMEACCFVVDFDIAKKVIEKNLEGTEFENYSRIYDESKKQVSTGRGASLLSLE